MDPDLAEAYRIVGRVPRGRQPASRPVTTAAPLPPAGQSTNAITSRPSSGLRRRSEAHSSQSGTQTHHQTSTTGSALAAPPPGTRYDIAGNPYNVTYQPPPAAPPPANTSYPTHTEPFEPTEGVYVPTPDGSHVYFTHEGVQYHTRSWSASRGYRTTFTPNQRSESGQGRQRTSAYPSHPLQQPPHPSRQHRPAPHQSVSC